MRVSAIAIVIVVRDENGRDHEHQILLEDIKVKHVENLPTRALAAQTRHHLDRLVRNVDSTPVGMRGGVRTLRTNGPTTGMRMSGGPIG